MQQKSARCSQHGGTNVSSTLEREINRVVHGNMTTPDIEAEIVKRALDTCCTVPQRKARTLRLLEKQRFLRRWRGARRLCDKEQLSRQYKSQTAAVKGAVRAYKRRKLEELAGEVEQAVCRGEIRAMCAMVKRSAPGTGTAQSHRVRQKDGSPTWGHDGEITGHRGALVAILGAEPLSLEAEPQLHQAKKWIPPETPVTHKAGDAQWAVAQLSNGKAGPCIRSGGLADQNKFGGAVAVQWKAVRCTACAGSTIGMCACHCCSMDRDCSHSPCSAGGQRHGDRFLTQFKKRHWECEELENHRIAQPHWQGLGTSIRSSTGASSCKGCRPMPIWLAPWRSTRCSSLPGKRVREIHQLEPPSKPPQLSPRRVLCSTWRKHLTPFRGIVCGQRSQMPRS